MKITVITPSYNQGQFLEETILSVLNQNYKNLEYFVIDGGSKDNSVEIIKKYTDKIDWWISEKDKGQTNAINKGLVKATGDIVMWLNSDDVLLPNTLNKVALEFQKNPSVILLHGKSVLFGNGKKELTVGKKTKDFKLKYLAFIPFPQPSSFFRKKLIDETGLLDETLHYGMDYELLVKAALNYEVKFVDDFFSRYRLHPQSKTNESLKFCKDWNLIFCSVLNSFNFTEDLKLKLKEIGLFVETKKHYTVKNKFTEKNIQKATLYHLQVIMHYHYAALDLKKAKLISKTIKSLSPQFYKQQKVGVINLRTTLLNRKLITLMRNFTRK